MTAAKRFIENQSQDCLRTKAAKAALEHVLQSLTPTSIVGIGTGATVDVFVSLLAQSKAPFAYCVSSSNRSSQSIARAGLKEMPLSTSGYADFYIDGIDEGMDDGVTVKGGGAALAREKVIATQANTFITIADSGRQVSQLGAFPLPIEILPAAEQSVTLALEKLGGKPAVRKGCTTDNGNIIIDVAGLNMAEPQALEIQLNAIPGIVENGIFAHRKADYMAFSNNEGVYWHSIK